MKEQLHQQIVSILNDLQFPPTDVNFEKPKVEAHGDLTTNVAMVLAKAVGKNPRQVAQSIVERIDPKKFFLESVQIAGPGFINFTFSKNYIVDQSREILRSGHSYGRSSGGKRKKTNVEWVSANPTGPLHSGHGRQVILGKAIANLLEWSGHDVTREYYFNNAGNQMRTLAESIYARYRQQLGDDYPLAENAYQGEYIVDIAKEIVAKKGDALRETDDERSFFKKYGEEWCFQ